MKQVASVAAALVVLVGCGGNDSASSSEADLMNPGKGPLGHLLGFDESSASQTAKHLAVEQAIAECMKDEGWEYQPRAKPAGAAFAADHDEQMADPIGYGERYGYGVVRSWESMEDAVSNPSLNTDPNEAYLATLTAEEAQAWFTSLTGFSEAAFEAATESMSPPTNEQGCYGKAQAQVHGDSPTDDPAVEEELIAAIDAVDADPAMRAANERWAACMKRKDPSYQWASSDDIIADLSARVDEAAGVEADGVDLDAIEVVRRDELAIWPDDHACLVEAEVFETRREVEQRIADDLLAQFPELAPGS